MLEHPVLCCRTCDAGLALTLPAHGIAECCNAARGTCGNNVPDAAPTHQLPALCWQCVQCQRGVCACGHAACGAASFRGLRHEDLVRAGLGKNQCTGMPPGLSAGEFTERVLHACLDRLLLSAGQTQALAAFVCAYPDSVCLLAGAHTPQPPHSPTSQRARRTSTLCNVVDMEAALHHAAKTCGLAVKIDAIREVVAMMQPDDGGMISHRAFRKFVQAETAFLASAYRWRLVRAHACRRVCACVCLHNPMHADIQVCVQLTSTRTVAQWHAYYAELVGEPACECAACRLWARLRTPGGAFAARETARWMRRVEYEDGGVLMRTCLWLRTHFARPPLRKPVTKEAGAEPVECR